MSEEKSLRLSELIGRAVSDYARPAKLTVKPFPVVDITIDDPRIQLAVNDYLQTEYIDTPWVRPNKKLDEDKLWFIDEVASQGEQQTQLETISLKSYIANHVLGQRIGDFLGIYGKRVTWEYWPKEPPPLLPQFLFNPDEQEGYFTINGAAYPSDSIQIASLIEAMLKEKGFRDKGVVRMYSQDSDGIGRMHAPRGQRPYLRVRDDALETLAQLSEEEFIALATKATEKLAATAVITHDRPKG